MTNTLIFIFSAISCGIAILAFKYVYDNKEYYKNYEVYLTGLTIIVAINFALLFVGGN